MPPSRPPWPVSRISGAPRRTGPSSSGFVRKRKRELSEIPCTGMTNAGAFPVASDDRRIEQRTMTGRIDPGRKPSRESGVDHLPAEGFECEPVFAARFASACGFRFETFRVVSAIVEPPLDGNGFGDLRVEIELDGRRAALPRGSKRAPRGSVSDLVERASRGGQALTPPEILERAATDTERLIKLASIRTRLHSGRRTGRYASSDGRRSLASGSGASEAAPPAEASSGSETGEAAGPVAPIRQALRRALGAPCIHRSIAGNRQPGLVSSSVSNSWPVSRRGHTKALTIAAAVASIAALTACGGGDGEEPRATMDPPPASEVRVIDPDTVDVDRDRDRAIVEAGPTSLRVFSDEQEPGFLARHPCRRLRSRRRSLRDGADAARRAPEWVFGTELPRNGNDLRRHRRGAARGSTAPSCARWLPLSRVILSIFHCAGRLAAPATG